MFYRDLKTGPCVPLRDFDCHSSCLLVGAQKRMKACRRRIRSNLSDSAIGYLVAAILHTHSGQDLPFIGGHGKEFDLAGTEKTAATPSRQPLWSRHIFP